MATYSLEIVRKDNGYSLSNGIDLDIVLQDRDDDPLSSHEELLWAVIDYFGFRGSKHDAERLRVGREKREE